MAQENFLINPPKRLKRRKRNPIGETLVTVGLNPSRKNPWFGDPKGHRIAALMRWGKIRRGKVAKHRKKIGGVKMAVRKLKRKVTRRKRVAIPRSRRVDRRTKSFRASRLAQQREASSFLSMFSGKGKKRKFKFVSGKGYVRFRKNPLGGSVMSKRRRSRKTNTWPKQPRRHRKAAKKGWRKGHMLSVGKTRRRVRHRNPMVSGVSSNPRRRHKRHTVRHKRRSHSRRRNPAMMAEFGKFTSSVMNVREWAPLAVTGGISAITGAIAPGLLGVENPWMKLGVQTAVAIGGGIVVEKFAGHRHGQAWMIVGVAMVGYQLIKQYVINPYLPQLAVGLGGYDDYYPTSSYSNADEVSQQVGAFPNQMSAFPSMSDYPGVGGDNVGAYPYDGAGY